MDSVTDEGFPHVPGSASRSLIQSWVRTRYSSRSASFVHVPFVSLHGSASAQIGKWQATVSHSAVSGRMPNEIVLNLPVFLFWHCLQIDTTPGRLLRL